MFFRATSWRIKLIGIPEHLGYLLQWYTEGVWKEKPEPSSGERAGNAEDHVELVADGVESDECNLQPEDVDSADGGYADDDTFGADMGREDLAKRAELHAIYRVLCQSKF